MRGTVGVAFGLSAVLLACGGKEGATPTAPAGATAPAPDPLRADAAAVGRWIGAAVQSSHLSDAEHARTLARHFNAVTAEYEMKWDPLEREPGQYDFSGADRIVDFAQRNGQRVKGHALVWHEALPEWVQRLSSSELEAALEAHIRTVVGRYRGRIPVWDVVNEAVAVDGSGLRDSVFRQRLGDAYVERAFEIAHEADPQALLVYNDFGGEGLGGKSDRIYELVRRLRDRGVPIGGIGLQMHIVAQRHPPLADIAANLRRLANLGLKVNLSEMDVRIRDVAGDRAARLEVQRQEYHDIVALCVAEPECDSITLWGFTDRYSWIDGFFGPDDPLLFDESYQPKPAFFGVQDALRGR